MILNDDSVDLMVRIVRSTVRCAKYVNYFNASSTSSKQFVTFSQNCFGELAVLHWSTVFGSWEEPTHYKKYFDRTDVLAVSENKLSAEKCKDHFLNKISMDEKEYNSFWEQAHGMRNKFIAHRDDLSGVSFPDTDICKAQCYAVLEFMKPLLLYSISNGDQRELVIKHQEYINQNGSPKGIERKSRKEIAEVQKLLL